jgi:hypothetical protein
MNVILPLEGLLKEEECLTVHSSLIFVASVASAFELRQKMVEE